MNAAVHMLQYIARARQFTWKVSAPRPRLACEAEPGADTLVPNKTMPRQKTEASETNSLRNRTFLAASLSVFLSRIFPYRLTPQHQEQASWQIRHPVKVRVARGGADVSSGG